MILCSKMIVMSEKKMTSLLLYLFCLLNKKKHYTTSLLRESIKQSCKEEKGCSKFSDFLLESFIAIFLNKQEIWAFLFFSQQFQNKSIKTKEGQFSWNRSCWKKNRRKLYQLLGFFLSLSDKEFFFHLENVGEMHAAYWCLLIWIAIAENASK